MNFDILKSGTAVVTFTKKNGETRVMRCTQSQVRVFLKRWNELVFYIQPRP